jgi:hypothetical protein
MNPMSHGARELLAALDKAARNLHATQQWIEKHEVTDEDAEALGRALRKVFERFREADQALFLSDEPISEELELTP